VPEEPMFSPGKAYKMLCYTNSGAKALNIIIDYNILL
jgi:hypothetical protein